MQIWTVASGYTASIAAGKPLRPSTTVIGTSPTPLAFNSFITKSQNFAPSVCSIHNHFNHHCRVTRRDTFQQRRAVAFAEWRRLAA